MKGNFRRSMIWLHTYSGLLLSWLLFAVFVTGTLSYYADELDVWMQPEKLSKQQTNDVIPAALAALHTKPIGATRWNINLGSEREPKAEIRWQYPGQGRRDVHKKTITATEVTPRETLGGSFFVHFHYSLELRDYGGRYLTGFAAFIMLVAVFSGIFTHRRFFKDFFVLRWQHLERALTDVHAIIGIITIPFCFVICFSALLFYLSMYVPASASYHYDNGYRQLSSEVSPKGFERGASDQEAKPITDIQPILQQVKQKWPEKNAVSWISYYHPFDKNGYLMFYRNKSDLSRQSETMSFDAATATLLNEVQQPRIPKLISYVFLGLHEAKFANNSLRFVLFILGALSCALIATGSILWLNSRLERNVSHLGTRLTAWSNKAMLGGLPIGIITLFLANRLLSVSLEARESYELMAFLSGWGICGVIAAFTPRAKYWQIMLLIFAAGCFALPAIDIIFSPHYLVQAIKFSNGTFITISVSFIVTGGLSLLLQRYLKLRNIKSVGTSKPANTGGVVSC